MNPFVAQMLRFAVCGFWYGYSYRETRPHIKQTPGLGILYLSIVWGVLVHVYAIAILVAVVLLFKIDADKIPQLSDMSAFASMIWASDMFATIANAIVSDEQIAKTWVKRNSDWLVGIINESSVYQKLVEVTTRSRKSYIGVVVSPPMVRSETANLELNVILSGYRDEGTLVLNIIDDYTKVIGVNRSPVSIVIPLAEVVTAREFDLTLFRDFHAARN